MDQIIDDTLINILKLTDNYYTIIVNKRWYNILQNNIAICRNCNKITKINNNEIWTDNNGFCHDKLIVKFSHRLLSIYFDDYTILQFNEYLKNKYTNLFLNANTNTLRYEAGNENFHVLMESNVNITNYNYSIGNKYNFSVNGKALILIINSYLNKKIKSFNASFITFNENNIKKAKLLFDDLNIELPLYAHYEFKSTIKPSYVISSTSLNDKSTISRSILIAKECGSKYINFKIKNNVCKVFDEQNIYQTFCQIQHEQGDNKLIILKYSLDDVIKIFNYDCVKYHYGLEINKDNKLCIRYTSSLGNVQKTSFEWYFNSC